MILTDRALKDFLSKFGDREHEVDEIYLHALIIEFFDISKIIIVPIHEHSSYYCEIKDFNDKGFGNYKSYVVVKNSIEDFKTRSEATKQAIIKANEIYNNLNK